MTAIDTDECAQQCDIGPSDDGNRNEACMVAGGKHQPCNVRHYQSQETNGAAECGDHSSEYARDEQQLPPHTMGVHAQILGIACAQ